MKLEFKPILFLVLVIGLPLASYFWVFRPANVKYDATVADIEAKEQRLQNLQQAMCYLDDLDAEVNDLGEAVLFFEDKIPAEHEIHNILTQIARIASRHRMETRLFETDTPQPSTQYSALPIRMEILSDFDSYYAFLTELEQLPRITRIKQMELRTTDQDGIINAKLTLNIFYQPS
ncbi:MAG: type 4a pilus biogenesis protein PilO [Sedimentisphaerales bacterium]|nr:type 4a pilus biogenesis protein PilO [Sedimentisphaerales bacterium]